MVFGEGVESVGFPFVVANVTITMKEKKLSLTETCLFEVAHPLPAENGMIRIIREMTFKK